MLTVYIEYNADTRLMTITKVSTGGQDNAVGTAVDNLTTSLEFTFVDEQHLLDGYGQRVDFGVWLTDSDGHAFRPFLNIEEDHVEIPSTVLSNVKCGVLPIQLVFLKVEGETEIVQSSLNILNLAINSQLNATADSPVERYPQVTDAITNVSFDQSTATFTFRRMDGAEIVISLSTTSETHYEVQHYADLQTLTEAKNGDTATVLDTGLWYKLYIQYDVRTWYKMAGGAVLNGAETGYPIFYAPLISGTQGQYLESRGENQSPLFVDKLTEIVESDALATASQIKAYTDAETERATQSEQSIEQNLSDEITRAEGVEQELSIEITNEVSRAEGVEQQLSTAISDETARQTSQENMKADKTITVNGHPLSENVVVTKADVGLGNVDNTSDMDKPVSTATQQALDQKQDILVSGQNIKTINSGSVLGNGDIQLQTPLVAGTDYVQHNPTASRVYATDTQGVDATIPYGQENTPSAIVQRQQNGNITVPQEPVQDTDQASRGFVIEAVRISSADFLGTYDATEDLGLTVTEDPTTHEIISPTNEEIQAVLGDGTTIEYPKAPAKNDYVFVSLNKPSTVNIDEFRCFRYDGSEWQYEYTLNNSSFTQEQWDAINSGINSAKVTAYDQHIANISNPHGVTKAQVGLGNVVDVPTVDQPIQGSPANITSGAVYQALLNKVDKISQTGSGYVSNISIDTNDKTKIDVVKTALPTIAIVDEGTKNVVTDISQNDHQITITRGVDVGQDIPTPQAQDVGKVLQAVQSGSGVVLGYGAVGGGVNDVRVNGTSVVTEGIADVPVPTKTSDLQNDSGFITGLGFDDLSSHPTTIQGYGITDAKIESGIITLGSDSITPVTDISGKADKQNTVTNVSYDSSAKKIKKTINGDVTTIMNIQDVAVSGNYSDIQNNPIRATKSTTEDSYWIEYDNLPVVVQLQQSASDQEIQTKLATARTFRTNLQSTNTASFDGSGDVTPGVSGVLPVKNGGTGNSSVDSSPTSNSTKMVTSGGIYNAIQTPDGLFRWAGTITVNTMYLIYDVFGVTTREDMVGKVYQLTFDDSRVENRSMSGILAIHSEQQEMAVVQGYSLNHVTDEQDPYLINIKIMFESPVFTILAQASRHKSGSDMTWYSDTPERLRQVIRLR